MSFNDMLRSAFRAKATAELGGPPEQRSWWNDYVAAYSGGKDALAAWMGGAQRFADWDPASAQFVSNRLTTLQDIASSESSRGILGIKELSTGIPTLDKALSFAQGVNIAGATGGAVASGQPLGPAIAIDVAVASVALPGGALKTVGQVAGAGVKLAQVKLAKDDAQARADAAQAQKKTRRPLNPPSRLPRAARPTGGISACR